MIFIASSGLSLYCDRNFFSSVTKSQLVAAMLAFTSLFLVIAGSQQVNNTLASSRFQFGLINGLPTSTSFSM